MKLIIVSLLALSVEVASANWLSKPSPQENVQTFKDFVQNERRVLEGSQIQGLQNLRQSLQNSGFNVKTPGADLTYKSIVKAVADYSARNVGQFGNNKSEKNRFDEFYKRTVLSPCKVLVRDLPKKTYKALLHDPEVQSQLDMDSLEWLLTTRMCLALNEKEEKGAIDSYEALLGHKYHKTSVGQLLHKVHLYRRRR